MKRLERLAAALTPKRWPVRWRLAAVSAGLTFIILVIFALVVGRLTSNRLHDNFDDELRDATTQFVRESQLPAGFSDLQRAAAGASAIRVLDINGHPDPANPGPDLGPPPHDVPGFTSAGSQRVFTVLV